MLVKVIDSAHKIQNDFKTQDYNSLAVDFQTFVGLLVADIKCYQNEIDLSPKTLAYNMIFGVQDQKQCIIDHLNNFIHEMKEALKHLFEGDVEGAKFHLKKGIEILQDIKNC